MEGSTGNEVFEIERSPLRAAYVLLAAKTPLGLSHRYSEEDQKLMKDGSWDYNNPNLVVNKVKEILEAVDSATLTEEEKEYWQEILWFWHHHAISCATWRYKDKEKAQFHAAKALEYQSENHPNTITKLLYLLINDKLEEAEEWASQIPIDLEKETADALVKEYKEKGFFE
ncbi:MAG TPA: hypothetical protein VJC12_02945 [Candidatus Paceibacterota bacterium]